MSSSSKIEMTKLVSHSMSKKQLFGNLNLSAANLPSFEDKSESDDKQEGNNDESTETKHQLKSPSSRKKIGKKRKAKMDELMNKDWEESLASFKNRAVILQHSQVMISFNYSV